MQGKVNYIGSIKENKMYKSVYIKNLEKKYKDFLTQSLIDNDLKEINSDINKVEKELSPLIDEFIILLYNKNYLEKKRKNLVARNNPIEFEGDYDREALTYIKKYLKSLFKIKKLNYRYNVRGFEDE